MNNEDFNFQEKKLLDKVPFEFRSVLSYMAYERGHSSGYEEVLGYLSGLVHDLIPAIEKYTDRILK